MASAIVKGKSGSQRSILWEIFFPEEALGFCCCPTCFLTSSLRVEKHRSLSRPRFVWLIYTNRRSSVSSPSFAPGLKQVDLNPRGSREEILRRNVPTNLSRMPRVRPLLAASGASSITADGARTPVTLCDSRQWPPPPDSTQVPPCELSNPTLAPVDLHPPTPHRGPLLTPCPRQLSFSFLRRRMGGKEGFVVKVLAPELLCPGSNPGSSGYWLCDLGQPIKPDLP